MYSNGYNTSRTIASLTSDDSKVLGNLKPKLKCIKERYNLQTNKFKTMNSNWTPLKDKGSNHTVRKKCLFSNLLKMLNKMYIFFKDL